MSKKVMRPSSLKNIQPFLTSVSLALLIVASVFGHALTPELKVGILNRDAAVYSAASGKVYLIDADHNAVNVITSANAATSVRVGSGPVSIGVNNQTGMVYVVNSSEHSVSVIDGKTDAVVATVPTPARSYAVAVDEVNNKVYVANIFTNLFTIIDGVTNTATNVPAGSADAIVVDNGRKRVYLLHYETDNIVEFDPATGAIAKFPAGAMHEWGILRSGKTLYVTHVQDSNIAAIDLDTHAIRTLPTGYMPCAIAINSKTGQLYVANYGDGSVTIFDKDAVTSTVKVSPHPQALALDSDKGLLYVASPQENSVSVIDIKARRIRNTIKSAEHPYAIVVNPTTHVAYSANLADPAFTTLGTH